MKQHTYKVKMEWTGNLGEGTSNYKAYSRDHLISAPAKQIQIPGSSDPTFRGDNTRYNPEELLVSTISSCHMLWYLHLCTTAGITVISYVDHASGTMEEQSNGSGHFTQVILEPIITIENAETKHQIAKELHIKAHEMCFIANSLNFDILVKPIIK